MTLGASTASRAISKSCSVSGRGMRARGSTETSIGPNDGGQTAFCRCAECRKLDPAEGRKLEKGGVALTDRYVYFWNEIAKRVTKVHPDAWLTADGGSAAG